MLNRYFIEFLLFSFTFHGIRHKKEDVHCFSFSSNFCEHLSKSSNSKLSHDKMKNLIYLWYSSVLCRRLILLIFERKARLWLINLAVTSGTEISRDAKNVEV